MQRYLLLKLPPAPLYPLRLLYGGCLFRAEYLWVGRKHLDLLVFPSLLNGQAALSLDRCSLNLLGLSLFFPFRQGSPHHG